MFTAPYIMAAPAVVNTSQFNPTLTREQILKSQLPAGKIPADTQTIGITNKQVSHLGRFHIGTSVQLGHALGSVDVILWSCAHYYCELFNKS